MDGGDQVWVLLGQKTGDNNQLLALATGIGLPFRSIELRYNGFYRLPPPLLGASLASLTPRSRALLRPPWPELVLGIGNRSVPAALAIRKASGGKSKLVRLGNPRLHPSNFDLVITTPQYPVPGSANVIRLPLGISTISKTEPDDAEREWLAKLSRPHRLLLVGGDTFMWRLSPTLLAEAAKLLAGKPGSVIAIGSLRSGVEQLDAVANALEGCEHVIVRDRFPSYPALVADADEIYVTADSVAMISDAAATGKPVGLILPEKTLSGRSFYGLARLGFPVPVRDISRVWATVRKAGLAGTIDRPVIGRLDPNPLDTAVAAVRALLD